MSLLLTLPLALIYYHLSEKIVRSAVKQARKTGGNPVLVGWLIGIVMYSLVLWDFIPTHAMHQYYCATQGGFTVYKTLEQWKLENPGVAETLIPTERVSRESLGNITRYQLNQRFVWEYESIIHPLKIRERDEKVVDLQTGEVLARYVDFDTSVGNRLVRSKKSIRDYKWWIKVDSCPRGKAKSKWLVDGDSFITFRKKLTSINGVIQ